MISVIITSFKEPKTIGRAIEGFLQQDLKRKKFELIVSSPDRETQEVVKKYQKNTFTYFRDFYCSACYFSMVNFIHHHKTWIG